MSRTRLGRRGEAMAAQHLQALGYQVLVCNWRTRAGELDIVALDGDTLVFVEVKTRRTHTFGAPEESIDARKQAQLARLAELFLDAHPNLTFRECRFDVAVVDMTVLPPQVRLYRNAFYPPE